MAIKFKKFARYDQACAEKGKPFTVRDELGQVRGTFTVSLFDMDSKFVRVAIEAWGRDNKEELDKITDNELRGTMLFVNCFLHGWEGVLDENDKPVPFTPANAVDLLRDDEWLTAALMAFAKDVNNFQADPRAKKDDEAKN